jgi:hypothetical protein
MCSQYFGRENCALYSRKYGMFLKDGVSYKKYTLNIEYMHHCDV